MELEDLLTVENVFICKVPTFDIITDIVDNHKIGSILFQLDGWSLVKFYDKIGKYIRCSSIIDNKFLMLNVNGIEIKVVEYEE